MYRVWQERLGLAEGLVNSSHVITQQLECNVTGVVRGESYLCQSLDRKSFY